MSKYQKEMIAELVSKLQSASYTVFLSGCETYGFYTDDTGNRIISFQCEFSSLTFSGNYKTDNPQNTGTGWRIWKGALSEAPFRDFLHAYPPSWAVGDSKWRYTTAEEKLARYGASSNYFKVT